MVSRNTAHQAYDVLFKLSIRKDLTSKMIINLFSFLFRYGMHVLTP